MSLDIVSKVLFPAPKASYTITSFPGELIHIPREDETGKFNGFTLGLLFQGPVDATRLVIYAHPNGVDAGMMKQEMVATCRHLKAHALVVEYQGYGLLKNRVASEAETTCDVVSAYHFALRELRVPASQIILMGRSVGTGPSVHIGATIPEALDPCLIVLEAPFKCIGSCVRSYTQDRFSLLGDIAAGIVGQRFDSLAIIDKVRSTVLIAHGTKDTIVPFEHGQALFDKMQAAGKRNAALLKLEGYGHNNLPFKPIIDGILGALATLPAAPQLTIPLSARMRFMVRMPLVNPTSQMSTPPLETFQQVSSYNLFTLLSMVRVAREAYQRSLRSDGVAVDTSLLLKVCTAAFGDPLSAGGLLDVTTGQWVGAYIFGSVWMPGAGAVTQSWLDKLWLSFSEAVKPELMNARTEGDKRRWVDGIVPVPVVRVAWPAKLNKAVLAEVDHFAGIPHWDAMAGDAAAGALPKPFAVRRGFSSRLHLDVERTLLNASGTLGDTLERVQGALARTPTAEEVDYATAVRRACTEDFLAVGVTPSLADDQGRWMDVICAPVPGEAVKASIGADDAVATAGQCAIA